MLTIKFEEKLGEYKYKVVYIMYGNEVLDSFRVDRRLATEDRVRIHPRYEECLRNWENKLEDKG